MCRFTTYNPHMQSHMQALTNHTVTYTVHTVRRFLSCRVSRVVLVSACVSGSLGLDSLGLGGLGLNDLGLSGLAQAQPIQLGLSADSSQKAPLTVTFKATLPAGLHVQWIFGDGAQASGSVVKHTFYRPGKYKVRARIFDAQGRMINEGSVPLEVKPAGAEKAAMTVLLSPNSIMLSSVGSVSYKQNMAQFWLNGHAINEGVEYRLPIGQHKITTEVSTSQGKKQKHLKFSTFPVTTNAKFENEVIRLTNQVRSKGWNCQQQRYTGRSLAPLRLHPQLKRAAVAHSMTLAIQNKFDHISGLDGSTPQQRIQATGWKPMSDAENIASGQATPAEVVQAWLKSPGHCKNIMGDFQFIGVSFIDRKGSEGPYWTQLFSGPEF